MKKLYEVIEVHGFKKLIDDLLNEDEKRELFYQLATRSEEGDLIAGTGGARKIRVALPGRGKSGGARVIYVVFTSDEQVYPLFVYTKNRQVNLTDEQKAKLKKVIAELLKE